LKSRPEQLIDLPGAGLVLCGFGDAADGRPTAEAALVQVARSRLAALGLEVPARRDGSAPAELELCARLGAIEPSRDPYPTYCAWLDPLDSFLSALAQRRPSAAS
jgi:hypothetical protein